MAKASTFLVDVYISICLIYICLISIVLQSLLLSYIVRLPIHVYAKTEKGDASVEDFSKEYFLCLSKAKNRHGVLEFLGFKASVKSPKD